MKLNISGRITQYFINSQLTVLLMAATAVLGLFALLFTPREENPQIVVPAANVMVMLPGASAQEVEELVSKRLESKLWEIPGVEDVYSVSMNSMSVVTVKFLVGQDKERSLVKLYDKLMSNMDFAPAGASQPLVKPIDVDDVPIVAVTLSPAPGGAYDDGQLRIVADHVLDELRKVPGVGNTVVIGGRSRQVRVVLDPLRIAGYGLSPLQIAGAITASNANLASGELEQGNKKLSVETGGFFATAADVKNAVVGVANGKPVYLGDVAEVIDGFEETSRLTRIAFGKAEQHKADSKATGSDGKATTAINRGTEVPAVTIALAKRQKLNAVKISEAILAKLDDLKKTQVPPGIDLTVTRNDGKTANDAVNELVFHLVVSIIVVIVLLYFTLGWREAAIVALAIPLTLFITLAVGMVAGQTINRITLFALILSLGLLVDDAIVVVENIHRHYKLQQHSRLQGAILAVNEIGMPTILATLTVVLAFIPMAFVTGMMGPYMMPIPFNVPVAMVTSLFVAFIVTPWASYRLMRTEDHGAQQVPLEETKLYKAYKKILGPLLESAPKRKIFMAIVVGVFLVTMVFPLVQWVKFRMLPKANKNTFLVSIDMPVGTALESTDRVARAVGAYLAAIPEVKDYETYVGTGSVIDFNGLLRGGAFREASHFADVRVNLIDKEERKLSSEKLVLKMRPDIAKLAAAYNANIKLVEDPPGPPVRATVVAEIYGPDYGKQREIAADIRKLFERTDQVVDIDDSVKQDQDKYQLTVDKEKAALAGISTEQIVQTLRMSISGMAVSTLHTPAAKNPVSIFLRLPKSERAGLADLDKVYVAGPQGNQVPLSSLVRAAASETDKAIHHKNLEPVTYVFAEMGDRSQVYAVMDMMKYLWKHPLPEGYRIKWDGEMKLTLDVFRDLGAAMGVALITIYLLLVGRFRSFTIPVVIMAAIPLSMIGIMPGFAMTGVYFSATSMIGVIALAGIVVRNSIVLLEFILDKKHEGLPLVQALIEAGAIRTRPIVLTAAAAILGSAVIVTDPVWSGLALALIFGMLASTALTLVVIPLFYYMVEKKNWETA
ncbi:MAG: efflux RND transporter permease subunit [Nitrospirota bacterium]|nr:efflux RND transporter permease subunit [Nitrospirota bacterium]